MNVGDLIVALNEASSSEELRVVLGRALGDPELQIAYWLPAHAVWVDDGGRRLEVPERGDGASVIERGTGPVAMLMHAPSSVSDRERVVPVIAAAALALENARLQVELRSRLEEQAALQRVATLVAQMGPADTIFAAVTEEVGRLLGARTANMVRFDGGTVAKVVGGWSDIPGRFVPVGAEIHLDSPTALTLVLRTGQPARVDDYSALTGAYAIRLRELIGVKAAVAAPIRVGGRLWGGVSVSTIDDDPPPPADAEQRIDAFAELVSQAIANTESQRELVASRARIVQASDDSRRRIERDLHDGAQQRLISVALGIRLARAGVADPETTAQALDACSADLALALQELRELARGIHPAVLADRGLRPALISIAERSTTPVEIVCGFEERLPAPHEAALYFTASEAIANVAKHAQASRVVVQVERDTERVAIEIRDDGVGGVDPARGAGVRGLADRIEALGGSLVVSSSPGVGTTIRAVVPLPPE
jgi:signal transduction histidine kinase